MVDMLSTITFDLNNNVAIYLKIKNIKRRTFLWVNQVYIQCEQLFTSRKNAGMVIQSFRLPTRELPLSI